MTLKDKRDGLDTSIDPATGQQRAYLVLPSEESAKGFVRPVRTAYRHVGLTPKYPLRDLTPDERELYENTYVKLEEHPDVPNSGRLWTQEEIDRIGKGCGQVTTMARELAETYARDPYFYSGTYCSTCRGHFPVGAGGEFVWLPDGTKVGT